MKLFTLLALTLFASYGHAAETKTGPDGVRIFETEELCKEAPVELNVDAKITNGDILKYGMKVLYSRELGESGDFNYEHVDGYSTKIEGPNEGRLVARIGAAIHAQVRVIQKCFKDKKHYAAAYIR